MLLDRFSNGDFQRGAPRLTEALWLVAEWLLLASWVPGSGWRRALLRAFGARIGNGVVIKPRVRVKFPWRLEVGDHSWIGEKVWIDNLAVVRLGSHVCLSQGAYLCTGSHDWGRESFDLITRPIMIDDHAWIGAFARLAPGSHVESGAVLAMAGMAGGRLAAWTIHRGNPAQPTGPRPKSG